MNRSERRAAAARVKAASSSAPADIAELMAQANEAYRARRLAQAEIVCKQVLARAPAHATCLNLLGVVYQTAGRHRPAIKLFAKAIAVDGSSVRVERQTEAGYDEVVCPLPALVTVTAGVVEPRYPSFKGIMAAKSKPVDNLTVADLGIDAALVGAAGAGQEITDVSESEARGAGEIVVDEGDGAQRVVAFLEQLKVV